MSFPREIILLPMTEARFPTADQLGIPRPPTIDEDTAREIVRRVVKASHPAIVVSGSGRDPESMAELVELCELTGLAVVESASRSFHCFPMNHPLYLGNTSLKHADVVLVLASDIPWMPGPEAPGPSAYIAMIDPDPAKLRYPTYEFTADLRLVAGARPAIRALTEAARRIITASDRTRLDERAQRIGDVARARRRAVEAEALAKSGQTPIARDWLHYQIGQSLDDNSILIDDTDELQPHLRMARKGSYFTNPGSSGGWGSGAALGAKLAAPDRDVVVASGDGFWMFGVSNASVWSAAHHRAPFLAIVYQNRSYSTGTAGVKRTFGEAYAAKAGYEGGYFDPPIDFAKEAEAAGAYGENVRDPQEIGPAIRRGLAQTRAGMPAVIAVWHPRLLQAD